MSESRFLLAVAVVLAIAFITFVPRGKGRIKGGRYE